MKNDLMILLEAQEIDLEIDRLIKSKKEYPEQISSLKKEIIDLKTDIDETEVSIKENHKNRRFIEEEIAAERDALVKKEKKLLETKTNKEYTAVQHEIESSRERIDSMETEDLELLTELDTLNPLREELKEKSEAAMSANTPEIEDFEKRFNSIESDIAKHKKKLGKLLNDINKRTVDIYTRLRRGKGGLAVAIVDQNKHSCRGCYKQLPPQKVLEVRKTKKLIFCESCGRILVWDSRGENK